MIPRQISMAVAGVISVAVLWWFTRTMVADWDSLATHLARITPLALAAAVVLAAAFSILFGLCYHHSLRVSGASVRAESAVGVYLASQLGKYVPGRVLYVAGHLGLAGWLRVSVPQATMGFTVHHLVLMAAGALAASPLLGAAMPPALAAAVIVAVAMGTAFVLSGAWVHPLNALQRRRGKAELRVASRLPVLAALASASGGWIIYAIAVTVLTVAVSPATPASSYVTIGMAAVAAWLIGFLSIITPAGIGVREGTFVLLVRHAVPEAHAMAVAMIWRLIFTAVQVPMGALALMALGRGRPPQESGSGPVASTETTR